MSLTDTVIKNAKAGDKKRKIQDEKGMYLLILPSGKYFRLDYRFAGKRSTVSLGVYPETTLREARERRDEMRKLLQSGIDPNVHKKDNKLRLIAEANNTFEDVAAEWFATNKSDWTEEYAKSKWARLSKHILPHLAKRPIRDITVPELLSVLRIIEGRGTIEMAHRAKNIVGEVFGFAISAGRAERNIAADLQKAMKRMPPKKHMATITDTKEIGGLLRAIDGYKGDFITKCALRLAPLVFLRPGELRSAEWSEIDLENKLWTIPAEKMKMRRPHIVPLSRQALAILEEMKPLTDNGRYVFPCLRTRGRQMSNNTINGALRRLGFTKEEMTGHGFRSMASTILNGKEFNRDWIERQLAHGERNNSRAAYNHAEYMPQRTDMMQWWADYLDGLKNQRD